MKQFAGSLRARRALRFSCALLFALLALRPFGPGQGRQDLGRSRCNTPARETISQERDPRADAHQGRAEYSDAIVEQDIRALYATRQVQNVRIFAEPDGRRREGDRRRADARESSTKSRSWAPSACRPRALRKNIKLKINAPLDEDALGKARQDILDAYRAKGFNDVDVQYRVEADEARGTSRVVYTDQ